MTEPTLHRFVVAHDRSAVLFAARSNVGPVSFGTTAVRGSIEVAVHDGTIDLSVQPAARLEVEMETLTSGNSLYDVELQRRVDARRYPTTAIDLVDVEAVGGGRFLLRGAVTFHGVTRELAGTVALTFPNPQTLAIVGDHALDIRDFGVAVPSMLMLKIFPDVRVALQLEADLAQ